MPAFESKTPSLYDVARELVDAYPDVEDAVAAFRTRLDYDTSLWEAHVEPIILRHLRDVVGEVYRQRRNDIKHADDAHRRPGRCTRGIAAAAGVQRAYALAILDGWYCPDRSGRKLGDATAPELLKWGAEHTHQGLETARLGAFYASLGKKLGNSQAPLRKKVKESEAWKLWSSIRKAPMHLK